MVVSYPSFKGKRIEKTIPHHKCTEEEYAQFSPMVTNSKSRFQKLKDAGGFYCIDWDDQDPYLIYGDQNIDDIWQNL